MAHRETRLPSEGPDSRARVAEYDKDGSGTIDKHEMQAALRDVGLRLSDEEVGHMMDYMDSDGNGEVSPGQTAGEGVC